MRNIKFIRGLLTRESNTVCPEHGAVALSTLLRHYCYYYYYYLLQLGFHPVAVVLTLVHTIQMDI
jgi:hypothetical protein